MSAGVPRYIHTINTPLTTVMSVSCETNSRLKVLEITAGDRHTLCVDDFQFPDVSRGRARAEQL